MKNFYAAVIAEALSVTEKQVLRTIELLDAGATIPFISRYRKEATGGLDEVAVADIKLRYERLQELTRRKETVVRSIAEQERLTPELRRRIEACRDAVELEDIYLPFKPRRQTRAEIARRRGLEPLADALLAQRERHIGRLAERFVTDEVPTPDDALQGARDIVAERINEDVSARNAVRAIFRKEAVITSKVVKGKEDEGAKYRDYFDFSEPLARCQSHRLLAIRRGEAEGVLRVTVAPPEAGCIERLNRRFVQGTQEASEQVEQAVKDAYRRLLRPSIESEFAAQAKEKADAQAIRVFAENLRQLLLAPPLGRKRVMAIDPGYRTGCKVVCLDAQGDLLHTETIFPHPPRNEQGKAGAKLVSLVESYGIEAIAIGNGTAGRETEQFAANLRYDRKVQLFVVSEDGASVYSASAAARDEFPDFDVTVRGAVSIGRRLIDPLAELVKIDPKSIGVGQYQHDVDQTQLKQALDRTVESCVNSVGVDLNTAGRHLLTYVAGLGTALARRIVDFRTANGPFKSRRELLQVPRLGEKAYEQCAGFLRIPGADNPLDNSAVHPESYPVVEAMAADLRCSVGQLIADRELRKQLRLERYVTAQTGMPTLLDIVAELDRPGRDPRQTIRVFEFDPTVRTLADLREGQTLPGIVSNITAFGCFVDIGIKEKGLVHISEMADRFVADPSEVVAIHQHIQVRVIGIDAARGRVSLSMKL